MQVIILAGGSGTRFWPVSRRRRPKQLLTLEGEGSLLQATWQRLGPLVSSRDTWICTTRELAPEVRRQLPEVPPDQVLAEPEGRNTAPAIGWSIASMDPVARRGVVAVLPADHRIADGEAFRRALLAAAAAVEGQNRVLTLGVTPRWAETGYGYLETGEILDAASGLRRVVRFIEKPGPETARRFLKQGNYLWNAGIFVFRGSTMLELIARFEPEIADGVEEISRAPERLDEIYGRLPAVSIDYGVMEKLEGLATLPLDCGWSDLGSWTALAEVLPLDRQGNAVRGEIVALEAEKNLLFAEEGLVAVLGVSGLVVVSTGDAVLVVPRDRAQEVRRIVSELRETGRRDLL